MLLKQSTTHSRTFLMVQSADHITGLTGATVTVNIGKAGGTGAAAGGTVSEIDSTNLPGWYKVALTTTDTNTLGELTYHCTATSADPTDFADQVIAVDLNTVIETQVWDALRANHQVAGSFGLGLQLVDDGTAQAGASGTITLRAGSSATDNFYKGDLVWILGGTGANQPPNVVISYVGATKVATLQNTWTVTPDNTSVYVIIPSPFVTDPWDELRASHAVSGSFGEGVSSVQGSVTGSVASVTAAVSLTVAERAAIADKLLGRNLAGGSDGTRTVQDALRVLRNKRSITAGTLTVCAEDDTTPAWTAAIVTTAGNPVSAVDPA